MVSSSVITANDLQFKLFDDNLKFAAKHYRKHFNMQCRVANWKQKLLKGLPFPRITFRWINMRFLIIKKLQKYPLCWAAIMPVQPFLPWPPWVS